MTDGILLIDKPAGKTSHDVVAGVRRSFRGRKVGHAGTLDPFATGLLIVLVGRATRVQRYIMGLPKEYETEARLGAVSTTGDPEGEITETGVIPPDPFVLPTGEIRQRPPAYSAIKIDGVRAYTRARRGEEVDVPQRTVTVSRFDERWRTGDRAAFTIACSSGTYIRSLVADLGDAYCVELRRTAIGPFSVDDADPEKLIDMATALSFLPCVSLDAEQATLISHGRGISVDAPDGDGPFVLADAAGVVAIAERRDEQLRPVVGFRS